jgi:hypothetical protein
MFRTCGTLFNLLELTLIMTYQGEIFKYDRSMIKKMPGKKYFMGNNLEVVCLLQSAEI